MRTVTVKDNQIVVEVDGAKVRYPLEIVRKRINSLLQDLETWREYERLLTPRVPDVCRATDGEHVWVTAADYGEVCAPCGIRR